MDGRFVAFESSAANLVAGDTNGTRDIFVRDRQKDRTRRVSLGPGGAEAEGSSSTPAMSADGRFVAYDSAADNLVPGDTNLWNDVFVHDRETGRTTRVSVGRDGGQTDKSSYGPAVSAGGRVVAFDSFATDLVPRDTNSEYDVFVHAR